jgi:hypothetical protein
MAVHSVRRIAMVIAGAMVIVSCDKGTVEPRQSLPVPTQPGPDAIPPIANGNGDEVSAGTVPKYIRNHSINVNFHADGTSFTYEGTTWELVSGTAVAPIGRGIWPAAIAVAEMPDEIHFNGRVFRRNSDRNGFTGTRKGRTHAQQGVQGNKDEPDE